MKRISDIFSYVKKDVLSLEDTPQAFNDVVNNGKSSSLLEFCFDGQPESKDMQDAINELVSQNKEVALVKINSKEVAVVGFVTR